MTATNQLVNLATNPNGFAFDTVTGASYQISQLGLEIIGWIKEGTSVAEITERVTKVYEVDSHTAERDITTYIANLRSLGLVEG